MRLDKSQIRGSQFMMSMTCFIQASSLLTAFLTAIAHQDSWLVVMTGIAVCLPLIWLFRCIMVRFPDRNLLQILEEVYGKAAGKLIGAAYIWFFLTLGSVNLMDLGDFTKLIIMRETPTVVLVLLCVLVSSMAVRRGAKLVTRYSTLFTAVAFVILFLSIGLVANLIDLQNFLPMFEIPVKRYVQATHIILTIPFGELVVFLMVHPCVKMTRGETTKYMFVGFGLGAFTVLSVLMRDIAVLGNTLGLFALPNLITLQLVNFGMAISRVEILFMVVLIMLMFFKITLLYYVTVLAIAQFFQVKAWRHLVLAVGGLMIAYGLTLYPCPVKHSESAQQIVPILWTLFEILIPLATFFVAKLRKLPKAKEASA